MVDWEIIFWSMIQTEERECVRSLNFKNSPSTLVIMVLMINHWNYCVIVPMFYNIAGVVYNNSFTAIHNHRTCYYTTSCKLYLCHSAPAWREYSIRCIGTEYMKCIHIAMYSLHFFGIVHIGIQRYRPNIL